MNDRSRDSGAGQADDFDADLHPNTGAGQNNAARTEAVAAAGRTAADDKELHGRLPGFTAADLAQIVLVPAGQRLEQGATYYDLAQPARGVFTATAGMLAEEYQRLVPKAAIDYVLWNRITGVIDPARLDQATT